MADPSTTRRNVLRAGTSLVALGALSGCSGPLGGDGSDGTNSSDGGDGSDGESPGAPRADRIPAAADTVVHLDVARLLDDDLVRQRFATALAQSSSGTDVTLPEYLERVESQTGLDPRAVSEVLAFGSTDGALTGAVVWADWDEATVTEQFQAAGEVQTSTHAGQTVYTASDTALAVTADGAFAVGSPNGVEAALAVHSGDADPLSGTVREQYLAAPDGYARFAFSLPQSFEPSSGGEVDASALGDVESGYGALYRGDGSRGGTVVLVASSTSAASDVADAAEGALALAARQLSQAEQNREFANQFQAIVDATAVSQDGATVTVETDDGNGWLPLLPLAAFATFALGLGESRQVRAPQVAFAFDYSEAEETLEIVHQGGDAVAASQLTIRGEGLATGTWTDLGGSASGDVGGEAAVVAGDSLTLDAGTDYEVHVVWEAAESDASAVLAASSGADA
ncbi:type IV pilin [Halobacteriales archaeon Cl-PHB]